MSETREIEVLLVEDNPTDAELTIHVLKKRGLTASMAWVKDGAEALDFIFRTGPFAGRAGDRNPKVVLLDLRLPKVDGIEVLRRIKSDDRTKLIPVVILTSSKEEKDVTECYALGANSYITKPIEFEDFSKTVDDLGLYWLVTNKLPQDRNV